MNPEDETQRIESAADAAGSAFNAGPGPEASQTAQPPAHADPRDAEIAELRRQLHAQSVEAGRLRKANEENRMLREENERLKAARPRDIMQDIPEELRDRVDEDQMKAIGAAINRRFDEEARLRQAEEQRRAAEADADFDRRIEAKYPGLIRATNPGGDKYEAWEDWKRVYGPAVAAAYSAHNSDALFALIDQFLSGVGTPSRGAPAAATPRPSRAAPPAPGAQQGRRYTFEEYAAEMDKAGSDYRSGAITGDRYREIVTGLKAARAEGRVEAPRDPLP